MHERVISLFNDTRLYPRTAGSVYAISKQAPIKTIAFLVCLLSRERERIEERASPLGEGWDEGTRLHPQRVSPPRAAAKLLALARRERVEVRAAPLEENDPIR